MSLVKEIRVDRSWDRNRWFLPGAFNRRDLRCFSAFTNVRTLRLQNFQIPRFVPHIRRYFGQFSRSLRSLTLFRSQWTPQQPSHFLSLFSNLDDIELYDSLIFNAEPENLVPFSTPAPKLRGRLALYGPHRVKTWAYLNALCGGLQFRHIDLRKATSSAPVLLEACAKTLETLRFNVADGTYSKSFCTRLRIKPNGEQNSVPSRFLNLTCRGSKSSDP